MAIIIGENLVNQDNVGIPIYAPEPAGCIAYELSSNQEIVLPVPVNIDGYSARNLMLTSYGNAVFLAIDQNSQPNSIVNPSPTGEEGKQILISGTRSVNIPYGSTYIHFAPVSSDACLVNIEFRR